MPKAYFRLLNQILTHDPLEETQSMKTRQDHNDSAIVRYDEFDSDPMRYERVEYAPPYPYEFVQPATRQNGMTHAEEDAPREQWTLRMSGRESVQYQDTIDCREGRAECCLLVHRDPLQEEEEAPVGPLLERDRKRIDRDQF